MNYQKITCQWDDQRVTFAINSNTLSTNHRRDERLNWSGTQATKDVKSNLSKVAVVTWQYRILYIKQLHASNGRSYAHYHTKHATKSKQVGPHW
jgi:hypothetical protein